MLEHDTARLLHGNPRDKIIVFTGPKLNEDAATKHRIFIDAEPSKVNYCVRL